MPVSSTDYRFHFLDSVDFVISGRKGSISENHYLINNYDAKFYPIVRSQLKSSNNRVKTETVILLTKVNERAAADDIKALRAECSNEYVTGACIGYLNSIKESDDLIPQLFDILEHKNGIEFKRAANRMRTAATADDIPRLRKIYGQVSGSMQDDLRETLQHLILRYPELKPKEIFIISIPVFPDEKKFEAFLDKSIVYLDIRYRDNIEPRSEISVKAYNNVVSAIKSMQVRLYNEKDNLKWYSKDKKDLFNELEELIQWASEDLVTKKVIKEERKIERVKGLDGI